MILDGLLYGLAVIVVTLAVSCLSVKECNKSLPSSQMMFVYGAAIAMVVYLVLGLLDILTVIWLSVLPIAGLIGGLLAKLKRI